MPSLVAVKDNEAEPTRLMSTSSSSPSPSSTSVSPAVVPPSSGKKRRKTAAAAPSKKTKKAHQSSIASFFVKGKKKASPPLNSTKSSKELLSSKFDKEALRDIVLGGPPPSDDAPSSPSPFKGVIPLPPEVASPMRTGLLFSNRKHRPTSISACPVLRNDIKDTAVKGDTNGEDDEDKTVPAPVPNDVPKHDTSQDASLPSKTQHKPAAVSLSPKESSIDEASAKPTDGPSSVTPERTAMLQNHQNMRQKYTIQFQKVISIAQDSVISKSKVNPTAPVALHLSAQDQHTAALAAFVQDSPLPLSSLADQACQHLNSLFPDSQSTPEDAADKIKLIATREFYVATLPNQTKPNLFEDDISSRLWFWEVAVVDLLPDAAKVKKARSARRKVRSHTKAISKLLATLDTAANILSDPKSTDDNIRAITTRITHEEAKVLKFDRDVEKVRLQDEAKRQKEAAKRAAKTAKLAAKSKDSQKQTQSKKQQKAEQKRKALLMQQEKSKKQKARMMSFFVAPANGKAKTIPTSASSACSLAGAFKSEHAIAKFRSSIGLPANDSQQHTPLFRHLSPSAKKSRRRRTKRVPVQVYVTVVPTNSFEEQPYADLKTIRFPNRYKLLRFYEDVRPPYRGTWRKKSTLITGRTPFAMDDAHLDYDLDSEAEWEEGDDEIGEDIDGDANDDEDENLDPEGDTRKYNYQDGWLAADDDFLYEDGERDQDTIELRREIMKGTDTSFLVERKMCNMGEGGLPFQTNHSLSEGFDPHASEEIELQMDAVVIFDVEYDEVEQNFDSATVSEYIDPAKPKDKKSTKGAEIDAEKLSVFVEFVHRNTISSKEQLIEKLRKAHPEVVVSRAQAMRTLDRVATKQKDKSGVSIWLVGDAFLHRKRGGLARPSQSKTSGGSSEPEPVAESSIQSDGAGQGWSQKTAREAKNPQPSSDGPLQRFGAKHQRTESTT